MRSVLLAFFIVFCTPVHALPGFDKKFIRGDCNGDGLVNISDQVFFANWWQASSNGVPAPAPCYEALNVNNDNGITWADYAYLSDYLWSGGPMPPPPFPLCGYDSGGFPCSKEKC